jgi:hypothetical protein
MIGLHQVLMIGLHQVQAGTTGIPHLPHGKTDAPQAIKF